MDMRVRKRRVGATDGHTSGMDNGWTEVPVPEEGHSGEIAVSADNLES